MYEDRKNLAENRILDRDPDQGYHNRLEGLRGISELLIQSFSKLYHKIFPREKDDN